MKTLKIETPEGYEIEKIVFKKKNDEKEELFLELFQGLQIKSDIEKYPNSVFYFDGEDFMLEIENNNLWVSCLRIWEILEGRLNMNYTETQSFIKEMVEKHFKWKGLTPNGANDHGDRVKKHFNN